MLLDLLDAHTVHMNILAYRLHCFHRRWQTTKNGKLHFIAASSLSALLLAAIKHSIIKGSTSQGSSGTAAIHNPLSSHHSHSVCIS